MVTVQGLDPGNPPAPGVEWSVNGGGLTSGGGVTVSDTSVSFSDVRRSHSGEYSAVVGNVHGNVTADFTLDVICECSLSPGRTSLVHSIAQYNFLTIKSPIDGAPLSWITYL